MALSPSQLNKWTLEDEFAVTKLESYADGLLLEKKVPLRNGVYTIVFPKDLFEKILAPNPNGYVNALIGRYRVAKWGEVNGGILGDGSATISLREHAPHYPNSF